MLIDKSECTSRGFEPVGTENECRLQNSWIDKLIILLFAEAELRHRPRRAIHSANLGNKDP